jgi:hypothetical protein
MSDEIWQYYAKDSLSELEKTTQILFTTREEMEKAREDLLVLVNKWKDIARSFYNAVQIDDKEKIELSVVAYENAIKGE